MIGIVSSGQTDNSIMANYKNSVSARSSQSLIRQIELPGRPAQAVHEDNACELIKGCDDSMSRDPVTVRFLGSGDAFGNGGRLRAASSSILSRTGFSSCGETALIGLKRFGLDSSVVAPSSYLSPMRPLWRTALPHQRDPGLGRQGRASRHCRPTGPPESRRRAHAADLPGPEKSAPSSGRIPGYSPESRSGSPLRVTAYRRHTRPCRIPCRRIECSGRVIAFSR